MKTSLDSIFKEAIDQVVSAGIEPGNINPKVKINTRAKKRFGQCAKVVSSKHDYEIEINSGLLKAEKKKLMNTLVHEILHTCKGSMNHGTIWKNNAKKMNDKFGYDISRTTSYEKIGIERPASKYTIECKSCGVLIPRQKKSKLVTQTHNYRCGCGGSLKLI